MNKKRVSKKNSKNSSKSKKKNGKNKDHPRLKEELTLGQRTSDKISEFGGSWTFIIIFLLFIFIWMIINSWILIKRPYDPYPYILLNLVLSCLAAIQAPIILMAQNRQAERDRIDANYDHQVNRKAERENQQMMKQLDSIKRTLREMKK